MLQKPDPILFYNENTLFEDELADNGSSEITIKTRVMPSCAFSLMRFFLRVDGILFRIYETRIFIDFTKNYVIREFTHKELSYNAVVEKLGEENMSKVRDPQAVSEVLDVISKKREKISPQ
eukprot:TRINITY_DN1184_c0_g1_i1.p1 TRINITY_DN1184_c0_g1~~TRINITY_DN1184_c0_g1_i1.p1  ORF type:complete len:121 (+),score=30.47 TRINITY_DN1184_c0_g1_i1:666-1028(+)